MIRFAGVCALIAMAFASSAQAEEMVADRETKVEMVQYPKGSSSSDVYLQFRSVESSPGESSPKIEEVLDLSEFPKSVIDGKVCYAVLPGSERYAKVLSYPTPDHRSLRVRFEVFVRPPCCPPEEPKKLMNVTGTVIIGPEGFRLTPKDP